LIIAYIGETKEENRGFGLLFNEIYRKKKLRARKGEISDNT
jgi:hypothetical protein